MTADVVVVVPVLGRPEHAARFMESFRANTPEGRAVVVPVVSMEDPVDEETFDATLKAWSAHTTVSMTDGRHTFAAKVNAAYRTTEEPWLLLVGSDVVFHPGWLEAALMTAELLGAKLIATNDLGNAKVMAGEHATHPLVNRAWVDEHGASWDGPGVLAHEGYRHLAVDNEWTKVAQEAGVFAYNAVSIVEHMHPYWGKGNHDDTYKLGEASATADLRLFGERWTKYGGKQ